MLYRGVTGCDYMLRTHLSLLFAGKIKSFAPKNFNVVASVCSYFGNVCPSYKISASSNI